MSVMTWGWAGVRGTACWSLIMLVEGSSRGDFFVSDISLADRGRADRWFLC